MSIQDKIAKGLIRKHGQVLSNHMAGSWWTDLSEVSKDEHIPQYQLCNVVFGKDHHARLTCHVADTDELQMTGLGKHASLDVDEGMLFTFPEPRKASFHMSTVSFPIDIIFVGSDGRVTKKVENIEPGTKGIWTMPHTSVVVEANGGFCANNEIEVGTEVFELSDRLAQETFTTEPRKDFNPRQVPPNPTRDRFRDHDLIDVQTQNQPMSQHHEEQFGHDPTIQDDSIEPIRPG